MRRLARRLRKGRAVPSSEVRAVNQPALDVYSIGASVYSMLTGCMPPLEGQPLSFPPLPEAWPQLQQLKELLSSCLADDPAQRPALPALLRSPQLAWLWQYDSSSLAASEQHAGRQYKQDKVLREFYSAERALQCHAWLVGAMRRSTARLQLGTARLWLLMELESFGCWYYWRQRQVRDAADPASRQARKRAKELQQRKQREAAQQAQQQARLQRLRLASERDSEPSAGPRLARRSKSVTLPCTGTSRRVLFHCASDRGHATSPAGALPDVHDHMYSSSSVAGSLQWESLPADMPSAAGSCASSPPVSPRVALLAVSAVPSSSMASSMAGSSPLGRGHRAAAAAAAAATQEQWEAAAGVPTPRGSRAQQQEEAVTVTVTATAPVAALGSSSKGSSGKQGLLQQAHAVVGKHRLLGRERQTLEGAGQLGGLLGRLDALLGRHRPAV
jgi:hypothetical protein